MAATVMITVTNIGKNSNSSTHPLYGRAGRIPSGGRSARTGGRGWRSTPYREPLTSSRAVRWTVLPSRRVSTAVTS